MAEEAQPQQVAVTDVIAPDESGSKDPAVAAVPAVGVGESSSEGEGVAGTDLTSSALRANAAQEVALLGQHMVRLHIAEVEMQEQRGLLGARVELEENAPEQGPKGNGLPLPQPGNEFAHAATAALDSVRVDKAVHMLTAEELKAAFPDSGLNLEVPKSSRGLSSAKAAELLLLHGRNELQPPKEHSELVKYLLQYTDPFMILLIIAGILSAAVAYPADRTEPLNLYLGMSATTHQPSGHSSCSHSALLLYALLILYLLFSFLFYLFLSAV
jgi:magnesium-transporting ATPase (P-type)